EGETLALEELAWTVLAGALQQLRLVVEHVQVRRRAGHVQDDDTPGSRLEGRLLRCQRIDNLPLRRPFGALGGQEGQRQPTESHRAITQKVPARHRLESSELLVHRRSLNAIKVLISMVLVRRPLVCAALPLPSRRVRRDYAGNARIARGAAV